MWSGLAYATKEVLLEVEFDVGVLLDGTEDLEGMISRALNMVERGLLYLDTLCGNL